MLVPSLSKAQRWKHQRVEYTFGLGATNFLGDLGGANQIGSSGIGGLKDIDFPATKYALGFGYRYQVANALYIKGNLYYAQVAGDDDLTEEPARSSRALNFRANIIELSGQFEYMFLKRKGGGLYRLRGVRGKGSLGIEAYLFGGIGGIWFDPQGQDNNGNWKRLKPLRTEGQGLAGGPSEYSGFSVVLPYGIGIRKSLGGGRSGELSISLELSMRKTFTDYIDDVSTRYYDNEEIRANFGDDAAFYADPSDGTVFSSPEKDENGNPRGQQRGDPEDKDAYMMAIISLNYKIARRRRNLPKF